MPRFRFPKSERIKSKKIFEETLLYGRKIFSDNQKLRCFYSLKDFSGYRIQAAFVVGKKNGKAVWRNRFKRILREIFRLNKHLLINPLEEKNKSLSLIFSSHRFSEKDYRKFYLSDLENEMLVMMNVIKKDIESQ